MGREHIDEWRLITLFPGGRARNNEDLLLRADDYRKLYAFVRDIRKKGSPVKVTLDEEGYLGCDFEREVRDSFYDCPAGIEVGGILANGDISACPSIPRRLVQGNIRTERFTDCWENKFQPFRDRGWMRQGMCESCAQSADMQGKQPPLVEPEKNEPDVCHFAILYGKEQA